MGKLDVFRKLIREEVKKAVREELSNFLGETKIPQERSTTSYKSTLKETLGIETGKITKTPISHKDPIQQLLAETAYGMDNDEYRSLIGAGSEMAQGFPQIAMNSNSGYVAPQPQVVETAAEMIASSRPTSDINQVEINNVPDFTALMKTMQNRGQI